MQAIDFDQRTHKIAENQPQYLTLPAHISEDGRVTTCWEPTEEERAAIANGANIFLECMTFNRPLQPLRMSLDAPQTS